MAGTGYTRITPPAFDYTKLAPPGSASGIDYSKFTPPPGRFAPPEPSSPIAAGGRRLVGQAIPTVGGFVGAEGGAALGASIGAFGGPADPITIPAGALIGGVIGAVGGGSIAEAGQQAVFNADPDLAKTLGQDPEQVAADESEHPVASFVGGLLPQAALLRPSGAVFDLLKGGEAATKAAGQLAIGGAVQGGLEATQEYMNDGTIDPGKVALSAGAGALLNKKTMLGEGITSRLGLSTGHGAPTGDGGLAEAAAGTDPVPPIDTSGSSAYTAPTAMEATPKPPDPASFYGGDHAALETPPIPTPDPTTAALVQRASENASLPPGATRNLFPAAEMGPAATPTIAPEAEPAPPAPTPRVGATPGIGADLSAPLFDQAPDAAANTLGAAQYNYNNINMQLRAANRFDDTGTRLPPDADNPNQGYPAKNDPYATQIALQVSDALAKDNPVQAAKALQSAHDTLQTAKVTSEGLQHRLQILETATKIVDQYSTQRTKTLAEGGMARAAPPAEIKLPPTDDAASAQAAATPIDPTQGAPAAVDPAAPVDPTQGTRGPLVPPTVEDAQAQATQSLADQHAQALKADRLQLLDKALQSGKPNPTKEFLAELVMNGHTDLSVHQDEAASIAKYEDVRAALKDTAPLGDEGTRQPVHGEDTRDDWRAIRDANNRDLYGEHDGQSPNPQDGQVEPVADSGQAVEPESPVPAAPVEAQGHGPADAQVPQEVAPKPPAPRKTLTLPVREPKEAADGFVRGPHTTDELNMEKLARLQQHGIITPAEHGQLAHIQDQPLEDGSRMHPDAFNKYISQFLDDKEAAARAAPEPVAKAPVAEKAAPTPKAARPAKAEPAPVDPLKAARTKAEARLDDLNLQDAPKRSYIAASEKMARDGVIDPRDHAETKRIAGDRDMTGDDLHDHLKTSMEVKADGDKAARDHAVAKHMAAAAEADEPGMLRPGMAAAIRSGSPEATRQWLADNADNPIIRKVMAAMKGGFGSASIAIKEPWHVPEQYREVADRSAGYALVDTGDITLINRPLHPNDGVTETVAAHELIHSYLSARMGTVEGSFRKGARDPGAVRDWMAHWSLISDAIRKNFPDVVRDTNWAKEFVRSPDEALTYSLTDPAAQNFLKSIDVFGNKITTDAPVSMWSRFVRLVARVLGLRDSTPPKALDALLDAGNHLLTNAGEPRPDLTADERALLPTSSKVMARALDGSSGDAERASDRKLPPEKRAEAAERTTVAAFLADPRSAIHRAGLNLATMSQIAELNRRTVVGPAAARFYDALIKGVSLRDTLTGIGAHIDDGWGKLPKEDQTAVGKALIDSTINARDLRDTKGNVLDGATPEREAAAKAVYNGVLDHYEAQKQQYLQLVRDTVNKGPGEASDKASMIAAAEKRLSKPVYFPLMRFGDHINVATNDAFRASSAKLDAARANLDAAKGFEGATPEQLSAAQAHYDAASQAHDASTEQNYKVTAHESIKDQIAAAADLKAQGFDVRSMKAMEYQPHSHGPNTAFQAKFDAYLAADSAANPARADGNAGLSLVMHQMSQAMAPEGSALKAGLMRKNVAGYSDDARRVFSASSRRNGALMAAMQNGEAQRGILADLDQTLKNYQAKSPLDAAKMTDVRNQLNKQYNVLQKYAKTPVQDFISNLTYAYMLGMSPSFMMMHLMQTLMVTHPMLSAYFNPLRVTMELTRAAKEAVALSAKITPGHHEDFGKTPGEKANLRFAAERGSITSTHSADFHRIGDNPNALQKAGHAVMTAASFLPERTERFNRIGTLNATYRMAVNDPKIGRLLGDQQYADMVKDNPWLAAHTRQEVAAMSFANKITLDSHVDYSGPNAAYLMQPGVLPLGKLATQFQKYQQAMIYQLIKNSRDAFDKTLSGEERIVAGKTLLGIVGSHAALTGAMGLPGYGLLALAMNMYHKSPLGDKDAPFDADDAFRQYLQQHLGKDVGDVIGRGLLYAPGIRDVAPADITDRLGMGDLVASPKGQSTGDDGGRNAVATYIGTALGGPAASLMQQFANAGTAHENGDDQKAMELMLPKVMRDIARTVRFHQEGVTTSANNPVVQPGEFSPADMAIQALGFAPQKVEEAYANRASVMDAKAELDARRKVLIKRYTDAALSQGDDAADKMSDMRDMIAKYNQEQIDRGVITERINGSALARAVQNRRLAGTRLKDGLSMSPKQRGLVSEYAVDDPNAQ